MAADESAEPPGTVKLEVTPMDRVRWAREIGALRSQKPAMTWRRIAKRTGLSQDVCQHLHAQLIRSGDPDAPPDAWEWVYRRLDALQVVMDEAASTYVAASAGSAAAVGALKLFDLASEKMLELARWVGWTPRQLGALNAERAMQEMFREFAAIVERYDVPSAALEEILDLAERRLSGVSPTIDVSASAA